MDVRTRSRSVGPVEADRWGTGRGRPRLRLAAAGGGGSPSPSDGDPGLYFTDFTPPPLTGLLGELRVSLRIWPPDCIPTHPEAFRVRGGRLRGYWVVLDFPVGE